MIIDLAHHELTWVRINYSGPDYELRTAATVVASLRGVHGECGDRSWTFKLKGIFRRRVTVSTPEGGEVAVLRWRHERGGAMELPEGRTMHFVPAVSASPPHWDWVGPDGRALAHFKPRTGFDVAEGLVEIEQEAAGLSELPLLVVLGEYLAGLLAWRRQADYLVASRHG